MLKYDPATFTWGCELEWGDIRRDVEIPEHLGWWDFSEVGIVNLRPPYTGRGADPLGKDPPVGGEINTMPTRTKEQQVDRVFELVKYFTDLGSPPTISSVHGLHFHVHVPGLKEDIEALKRLTAYTKLNQKKLFEGTYAFYKDVRMKSSKTATRRLSQRILEMPDYMCDNIVNMAQNFDDFIRIQCCGKDGVSRGRPFRYGINTYNLGRINTIEFRFPGATLDRDQFNDTVGIIERYLEAALNEGPPIDQILAEKPWNFAKFSYNADIYEMWENNHWPDERGTKTRRYVEVPK